jgi:hypothetical protein
MCFLCAESSSPIAISSSRSEFAYLTCVVTGVQDPKHFRKDQSPEFLYQGLTDTDSVPDPYLFLECLDCTCVLQIFNVYKNMYYMFKSKQVNVLKIFSSKSSII